MIDPHYFGTSEKPLFGIYHLPEGKPRAHGVILCPPAPQEYMQSHMALRKLALLLAQEGFHVLRFDYYGTGDSAGWRRDGGLAEWCDNIVAAASDLRDCAGITRVSMIGLRLGAALAALAPVNVSNLILWEPVTNGRNYQDELRAIHVRKFSASLYPLELAPRGQGGDVLGFPLTPELEAEIDGVDLTVKASCRAEHIAIVVSEERPEYVTLQTRLRETTEAPRGATVEYCLVPDESQSGDQEAMLLSTRVLHTMTAILSRRAA